MKYLPSGAFRAPFHGLDELASGRFRTPEMTGFFE
jgi:hypothetical protein